jgi:hypothetical protein
MIGFIDTSLQLQSIIKAHNQWLSKILSIPYWTMSVFSSTERQITAHTLNSLTNHVCLTNLSYEWIMIFYNFPGGPMRKHYFEQLLLCLLSQKSVFSNWLPSNDLLVATRCSGSVISEPLLSSGRPLRPLDGVYQSVA